MSEIKRTDMLQHSLPACLSDIQKGFSSPNIFKKNSDQSAANAMRVFQSLILC